MRGRPLSALGTRTRYDRPWASLKLIYEKGEEFWDMKVTNLAIGGGTRGSLNKRGQNKKAHEREGQGLSTGCRGSGASRHDHFLEYKKALKLWVEEERRNGHSLDGTDLMLQFTWTLRRL